MLQPSGDYTPHCRPQPSEAGSTKPTARPQHPSPQHAHARPLIVGSTAVDATATDNHYLHGLLLDYGKGDNPFYDPSAGLRDYLVQVDADNPDLFLGKAYFALGAARVPTFSFFILERDRPIS